MSEQKKRITFDEFIDERMDKYHRLSATSLLAEIGAMLETSWTRDDVANELADEGRELVADKVEQEPIRCQSCNEVLREIILRKIHFDSFRVTIEDDCHLHLTFDHQESEPTLLEATCAKCTTHFDLSDFEIHYNKVAVLG